MVVGGQPGLRFGWKGLRCRGATLVTLTSFSFQLQVFAL